jgi:acyl carrier protein
MPREKIVEVMTKLKIKLPSDENASLFDHGLDSLKLVQLVMALEKAFAVKLITKNFNRLHFENLQKIEAHLVQAGVQS